MSALKCAIKSLQHKIKTARPDQTRVSVELSQWQDDFLIDWLDAQPVYPKFYWQSRDGQEEVVALGQSCIFSDPVAAKAALTGAQRIWGGRSFDSLTKGNRRCLPSFFFLPQIELARQGKQWQLIANLRHDNTPLIDTLERLSDNVIPLTTLKCRVVSKTHTPNFSTWSGMIDKALSAISQQAFDKVVLARKTQLKLNRPLSSAQFLKASRQANHNSFHFMMALDDKHCFIGSTPERLYARDGSAIDTEAMAGTIGRGRDGEEDEQLAKWLVNDKKNRYENHLVVADIISRLDKHCSLLDVAPEPDLVKLRKVQHLKRAISGHLTDDTDDSLLLNCLQPTAAIAGFPREPALDFIAHHEPFTRGWYSGAVGFLSHERSEFCVAIRSALVMGDELHLFAGAGIVPGSNAGSEWQELERKTATLLSLIEPDQTVSEQQIA